ncbi:MAG: hypothetical protein LH472_06535 [Pyrinomonadaceae bacterium]|nr:hypothetical protein [Pyrinomonadaceae bacterium]
MTENIDKKVVEGFGDKWSRFDQFALTTDELARTALLLEKTGMKVEKIPLSQYRTNSFYVMRNDALDRFGTQLEKRFTKKEMQEMMENAGLENITFSATSFWTAVGYKK